MAAQWRDRAPLPTDKSAFTGGLEKLQRRLQQGLTCRSCVTRGKSFYISSLSLISVKLESSNVSRWGCSRQFSQNNASRCGNALTYVVLRPDATAAAASRGGEGRNDHSALRGRAGHIPLHCHPLPNRNTYGRAKPRQAASPRVTSSHGGAQPGSARGSGHCAAGPDPTGPETHLQQRTAR